MSPDVYVLPHYVMCSVGGKVVDSRAHLLKSPIYQYDGRTGNYDRVRSIRMEFEWQHQKVIIKAGYSGSHL